MELSELLVAILSVEPDGIDGRTAIQKLGYFTSVKLKLDAGYGPDLYGPYSSIVAAHLESLAGIDFIVERGRRTMRDRTMYSYYLTDDGKQLAKKVEEQYPHEYSLIKNIVEKCGKIVHYNYSVLSWAAKVHFILRRAKKAITYKEAIKASRLFSWKLTEEEIESGAKLLSVLGFIKKS
jgi:uncharacterized protein YwgA